MRFKRFDNLDSEIPAVPYENCIAKTDANGYPGLSVLDHCRIVGRVAENLLEFLPVRLRERFGDNPALAAALHDVGKVSPGFQLKYFRDVLAAAGHPLAFSYGNFDDKHARVGELTLVSVYGDGQGKSSVAQVAGTHHGSRAESFQNTDFEYLAEGKAWPRERRRLIQALEKEFGALGKQPADVLSTMLLAGLTCVSDWIGSDEKLFPIADISANKDVKAMARIAVQECGWHGFELTPDLSFRNVFGFRPYQMQADVVENITAPGVYVVEAPTGMGKTEAALYAGYKLLSSGLASGLYFGLPTRLTSDRIHLRVNEFLRQICKDNRDARLAHGTAWLSRLSLIHGPTEAKKEDNAAPWFNPLKRSLLYPFAVGTVDQALLGVLNVKHFFLRLFGLAGKVVILDEVHTYDMFTGTHLDELVKILRQLDCTVIILSATLTEARRRELTEATYAPFAQGYPLLTLPNGKTKASEPPISRKIDVALENWTNAEVAESAIQKASRGASVLCIANTVAQAQGWYRAIKSAMPEGLCDVGLLHSKFIGAHRTEKENLWMTRLGKEQTRTDGCILVATQVVEQSVDIDADFLITELAPTDMLIQRLGRLWRHPRKTRAVESPGMVIVSGELPNDGSPEEVCEALGISNTRVYSPYVLCRSREVWKGFDGSKVSLPSQVRELLEDTYREKPDETAVMTELRQQQQAANDKLQRCARTVQAGVEGIPVGRDDEHAATRYNDRPMRDVVLVTGIDDRGQEATLELASGDSIDLSIFKRDIFAAAKLHLNTVNIPAYLLPAQKSAPAWLSNNLNPQAALLVIEPEGELSLDGDSTGLAYDAEKGLMRMAEQQPLSSTGRMAFDNQFSAYSDYDTEECFNEFSEW